MDRIKELILERVQHTQILKLRNQENVDTQELYQAKKAEKLRQIKENELIEALFNFGQASKCERQLFEVHSNEVMIALNYNFQFKSKNRGLFSDIAEMYIEFFDSIHLDARVEEIRIIAKYNLYQNFPFLCMLFKWLIEISRKIFLDIISSIRNNHGNNIQDKKRKLSPNTNSNQLQRKRIYSSSEQMKITNNNNNKQQLQMNNQMSQNQLIDNNGKSSSLSQNLDQEKKLDSQILVKNNDDVLNKIKKYKNNGIIIKGNSNNNNNFNTIKSNQYNSDQIINQSNQIFNNTQNSHTNYNINQISQEQIQRQSKIIIQQDNLNKLINTQSQKLYNNVQPRQSDYSPKISNQQQQNNITQIIKQPRQLKSLSNQSSIIPKSNENEKSIIHNKSCVDDDFENQQKKEISLEISCIQNIEGSQNNIIDQNQQGNSDNYDDGNNDDDDDDYNDDNHNINEDDLNEMYQNTYLNQNNINSQSSNNINNNEGDNQLNRQTSSISNNSRQSCILSGVPYKKQTTTDQQQQQQQQQQNQQNKFSSEKIKRRKREQIYNKIKECIPDVEFIVLKCNDYLINFYVKLILHRNINVKQTMDDYRLKSMQHFRNTFAKLDPGLLYANQDDKDNKLDHKQDKTDKLDQTQSNIIDVNNKQLNETNNSLLNLNESTNQNINRSYLTPSPNILEQNNNILYENKSQKILSENVNKNSSSLVLKQTLFNMGSNPNGNEKTRNKIRALSQIGTFSQNNNNNNKDQYNLLDGQSPQLQPLASTFNQQFSKEFIQSNSVQLQGNQQNLNQNQLIRNSPEVRRQNIKNTKYINCIIPAVKNFDTSEIEPNLFNANHIVNSKHNNIIRNKQSKFQQNIQNIKNNEKSSSSNNNNNNNNSNNNNNFQQFSLVDNLGKKNASDNKQSNNSNNNVLSNHTFYHQNSNILRKIQSNDLSLSNIILGQNNKNNLSQLENNNNNLSYSQINNNNIIKDKQHNYDSLLYEDEFAKSPVSYHQNRGKYRPPKNPKIMLQKIQSSLEEQINNNNINNNNNNNLNQQFQKSRIGSNFKQKDSEIIALKEQGNLINNISSFQNDLSALDLNIKQQYSQTKQQQNMLNNTMQYESNNSQIQNGITALKNRKLLTQPEEIINNSKSNDKPNNNNTQQFQKNQQYQSRSASSKQRKDDVQFKLQQQQQQLNNILNNTNDTLFQNKINNNIYANYHRQNNNTNKSINNNNNNNSNNDTTNNNINNNKVNNSFIKQIAKEYPFGHNTAYNTFNPNTSSTENSIFPYLLKDSNNHKTNLYNQKYF